MIFMKKVKSVLLFPNGNTAVLDDSGNQIPELQKGWMEICLEWMEKHGVNISEIDSIEINFYGQIRKIEPFKTINGWNWRIKI